VVLPFSHLFCNLEAENKSNLSILGEIYPMFLLHSISTTWSELLKVTLRT
jgi:hypothetical protein